MPIQKDFKRLVRSRMKKTGEAYTAARLQVLKKREPIVNYAEAAGMSEAEPSGARARPLRRGQEADRSHVGGMGPHIRRGACRRDASS